MSNILYISCHSVLEYDELRLLTSLGHSIFAVGSYFDPQNPGESIRPALRLHQDPDWRDLFYRTGCTFSTLSKEFLAMFDVIIAMHGHKFIEDNLKNVSKNCRVFWRGIGQSSPQIEQKLKNLKSKGVQLIRYSPFEAKTANYAGEDYLVRFCKREAEFRGEAQKNGKGFVCYNAIAQRQNFNDWRESGPFLESGNFDVFGGSNESLKNYKGFLSSTEQLQLFKDYSKVFCLSSYPAPYTLGFIEAIMSDCEIFINRGAKEFDERFKFEQNYKQVSENIWSFNSDNNIRILFSEKEAKIVWNKVIT